MKFYQKENTACWFQEKIWFKHFFFALSQQWFNQQNTGGITYGTDALQSKNTIRIINLSSSTTLSYVSSVINSKMWKPLCLSRYMLLAAHQLVQSLAKTSWRQSTSPEANWHMQERGMVCTMTMVWTAVSFPAVKGGRNSTFNSKNGILTRSRRESHYFNQLFPLKGMKCNLQANWRTCGSTNQALHQSLSSESSFRHWGIILQSFSRKLLFILHINHGLWLSLRI